MNRSAVEMNCTKKKRMNVEAEVGIYKRKQESKKTWKQEVDQESDQEKKKVFPFFLGRFLGRVLVFMFSYFIVFFYKFPPQFLISLPVRLTNLKIIS